MELRLTHVRHDRGVCPRLGEVIRKPLVGDNEHHREENSGKTSVEAIEFGQRASEPPTASLLNYYDEAEHAEGSMIRCSPWNGLRPNASNSQSTVTELVAVDTSAITISWKPGSWRAVYGLLIRT